MRERGRERRDDANKCSRRGVFKLEDRAGRGGGEEHGRVVGAEHLLAEPLEDDDGSRTRKLETVDELHACRVVCAQCCRADVCCEQTCWCRCWFWCRCRCSRVCGHLFERDIGVHTVHAVVVRAVVVVRVAALAALTAVGAFAALAALATLAAAVACAAADDERDDGDDDNADDDAADDECGALGHAERVCAVLAEHARVGTALSVAARLVRVAASRATARLAGSTARAHALCAHAALLICQKGGVTGVVRADGWVDGRKAAGANSRCSRSLLRPSRSTCCRCRCDRTR